MRITKHVCYIQRFFILFVFTGMISSIPNINSINNFIVYSSIYLINIILVFVSFKLNSSQLEQIIKKYYKYIVVLSIMSLLAFSLNILPKTSGANIFGMLGINRNGFTFLLILPLFYAFFKYIFGRSNLAGINCMVIVITILMNLSRSAYIAIIMMLIFILINKNIDIRKRLKVVKWVSFFVVVFWVIMISTSFGEKIKNRILRLQEIYYILGGKELQKYQEGSTRQRLIKAYLQLLMEKPLFGVGIGQGITVINRYEKHIAMPHNLYLYILSNQGIIGSLFLGIFFIQIYLQGKKALKTKDEHQKVYIFALHYTYCTILLISFGNEYLFTNPFLFWSITLHIAYINKRSQYPLITTSKLPKALPHN